MRKLREAFDPEMLRMQNGFLLSGLKCPIMLSLTLPCKGDFQTHILKYSEGGMG